MKHAIILLAHKGYDYIDNFLSQFNNDPDFYYFIHLDTKCKWEEEKVQELKSKYPNIKQLVSEIKGEYCKFNLVEAELICIKEAYNFGCDYYHTMSESDYIICSIDYFKRFFEYHKNKEFLYNRCWVEGTKCSKDIKSIVDKKIGHIYNGAQWWSLTHRCIGLVLEKDKIYNSYYKNYKGYWMAFDEVYFQNIILADLKDENLIIENKTLRFTDWLDLEDPKKTHPNLLVYSKKYKYILDDNLIIRKIDYKNEDSWKYLKYCKKHFIEFSDYSQKKVLVCMCVYNREKIMLPSIKSLLEQTYKNITLYFIDDKSTDNTLETLVNIKRTYYNAEFNEHILKHKNPQCHTWFTKMNICSLNTHNFILARNKMFISSENININDYDYIAIIDSDDLYKQDKIEQQLRYFNEHPELDVVFSKTLLSPNNALKYTVKDLLNDDVQSLLNSGVNIAQICHFPTMMLKRECLDIFTKQIYFYPEFKDGGEDQIFVYTLLSKGKKVGVCSDAVYLYNYCKYSDSISANVGNHKDRNTYIFKNFFEKSHKEKLEFVNILFDKYNG